MKSRPIFVLAFVLAVGLLLGYALGRFQAGRYVVHSAMSPGGVCRRDVPLRHVHRQDLDLPPPRIRRKLERGFRGRRAIRFPGGKKHGFSASQGFCRGHREVEQENGKARVRPFLVRTTDLTPSRWTLQVS